MAQAPLLAQAAHSSSMQAGAAAVLAFRYGTVLLELLGGVLGCAGHLHDAFSVEVQHLMAVPQVCCLSATAVSSNQHALLKHVA